MTTLVLAASIGGHFLSPQWSDESRQVSMTRLTPSSYLYGDVWFKKGLLQPESFAAGVGGGMRRCRYCSRSGAHARNARSAVITLPGIELAHRIRKRQFSFGRGRYRNFGSLKQIWDRALASYFARERISNEPPFALNHSGSLNFERL
jgi:hypothetical protein